MKILQNNIQSVSTSIPLLRQCVQRLNCDVILLQEIWHPLDNNISIRNFTQPILKTRSSGEGGGVAIITHRTVKRVYLKEYEVDGLEAVWADVSVGKMRMVIGSVYIPPGEIKALDLLDRVIGDILQVHSHLLIGIDANSRNVIWDDTCIGIPQYRKSIQNGSQARRNSKQVHFAHT